MKKIIVNIDALDKYIIYPGNYIRLYSKTYGDLTCICVSVHEGLCSLINLHTYSRLTDDIVKSYYFKCIDGHHRLGYHLKEVLKNINTYDSIHILSYDNEEALENEIEL